MSTRSPQVHLVAGVEVTAENWSDAYVRQWVLCHKGQPVRDNDVVIKADTLRQLLSRMTSNRTIAAVKIASGVDQADRPMD
jgi:hypothetical protein